MVYSLSDIQVRRVLECLRSYGRKSLKEVTVEYNKRYPPSLIHKVIGVKVEQRHILHVLRFLVEKKLVEKDLFTYTDHALKVPEFMYCLTIEGSRYLGTKR